MKIAVLGYGTVGKGVDRIISERVSGVEVSRILELPDRLTDPRMTSDYAQIVEDDDIAVVVECMGGLEPAHTFILDALAKGKSVVTSNKAVVAAYFDEFVRQANATDASLLIEASVGGGIPWIASIEKVRRIDEVTSFSGIMNGTTNFIVDAMVKEDADFDQVLAEAQALGYAERDPSADIDGVDVRNKTIITVGVAFDTACEKDIPTTGIRTLTKGDLDALRAMGRGVKLLGRGAQHEGGYAAAVEPVAVPIESLEANVPSNFNLISLDATTVGPLKFYGQGAGMLPTGNASPRATPWCRTCWTSRRAAVPTTTSRAGSSGARSCSRPTTCSARRQGSTARSRLARAWWSCATFPGRGRARSSSTQRAWMRPASWRRFRRRTST